MRGSETHLQIHPHPPSALAFAVLHLGGTATELGLVVAAYALAQVVTTLVGGVLGDRLAFEACTRATSQVGWAALGYALVAYPLIGLALGLGYPESPLCAMAPCPTAIATFGLLLLARPPLPKHLLVIPSIWAVLAPLAAVGHGYLQDLGLFVVGALAVALILRRDRVRGDDRAPRQPKQEALR